MNGAIYVLSRQVPGDSGQKFNQTVTVFADSPTEARGIVGRMFAAIRRNSQVPERPYGELPDWQVEKIDLTEPKLITTLITT